MQHRSHCNLQSGRPGQIAFSAQTKPRRRAPCVTRSSKAQSLATCLSPEGKIQLVSRLIQAKEDAGITLDELAEKLGVTNVYAGQLLYNQTQLKAEHEQTLCEALPGLASEDVGQMRRAPSRSYDPNIAQDPHIYRMQEAVLHFGQSIKALVNEKFGDGIMSAIDFFATVDKVKGAAGEERVVITFNGKYLPYAVQHADKAAHKDPVDE